jgi:hypothetical protein
VLAPYVKQMRPPDLERMSFEQDPYEREDEEIRKAFAVKDAEISRLRRILCKLTGYIEDGTLVRDTSRDHETSWAMRMLPFVRDLSEAKEAAQVEMEATK